MLRGILGRRGAGEFAEFVDQVRLVVETALERELRPINSLARAAVGRDPREQMAEANDANETLRCKAACVEAHAAKLARAEAGVLRQIINAHQTMMSHQPLRGALNRPIRSWIAQNAFENCLDARHGLPHRTRFGQLLLQARCAAPPKRVERDDAISELLNGRAQKRSPHRGTKAHAKLKSPERDGEVTAVRHRADNRDPGARVSMAREENVYTTVGQQRIRGDAFCGAKRPEAFEVPREPR